MEHTTEHSSKPWSTFQVVVIALAGFTLFAVFAFLLLNKTVLPEPVASENQRAEERKKIAQELKDKSNQELQTTAWVDKEKQIVRLPIDRAIELTIVELQNKPVHPGTLAAPQSSNIVPPKP